MASQQPNEGDIWASRFSILAARNQNLLNSWLPSSNSDSNPTQNEDDEADFKGSRDTAGVGAINQDEDSELDGILKRKRTDNDKLLEQLIGKKAAEAHRKSQKAQPGKSMSMSKHAAPKPMTSSSFKPKLSRPQDSDDEEEVGRAAAFTSKRKTRDAKAPAYIAPGGKAEVQVDPDVEPPDPREELATVKEIVKQDEEQDTRSKKKKVGSYLDEVLGQRKKGKKKKKGKAGGGGE